MAKKNKNGKNSQISNVNLKDDDVIFQSEIFGNGVRVEEIDNDMTEEKSILSEPDEVILKRERTRGTLATLFIIGFFIVVLLGFLLVAFADADLKDKSTYLKDILITISGILAGPLGFIVGYYFRKQDEEAESTE